MTREKENSHTHSQNTPSPCNLTTHTFNSLTSYVNLREKEGKAMTREKETSHAHSRLKTKHMQRTNFHINSNILLTVRDKEQWRPTAQNKTMQKNNSHATLTAQNLTHAKNCKKKKKKANYHSYAKV